MITILGPTASGKTKLAVALAKEIDGEIISADSRQVYRGMDLGTGKDLEDYENVPYHLIDICNAGEKYNLFRYQQDFRDAYNDITSRGKKVILCGGTGLYIEAVLKNFNLLQVPEDKPLRESLEGKTLQELTEMLIKLKQQTGSNMHNGTDVDTPKRAIRAIEIEKYILQHNNDVKETADAGKNINTCTQNIFGTDISRNLRRKKITARLDERLSQGMIEEVKELLNNGIPAEDLIYYGLEYKFLTLHLTGKLSKEEMRKQLEIAIHQFAKRQMTWFRGMEKRGLHINWIDYELPMAEKVKSILLQVKGY